VDDRAEPRTERATARAGLFFALAAHSWWGLIPLYFKALARVPPAEVLCHRILWSLVFLAVLLSFRRRYFELGCALRSPLTLATLLLTSVLVGANWYLFIFAIAENQLLEASLGYFINPLVNVLLGFLFLGERLRRPQAASVVLAATGVAWLTLSHGSLPWIALVLAVTFGFYTLLRKTARVGSIEGLSVETATLAPIAAMHLWAVHARGAGAFLAGPPGTDVLLAATSVMTTLPLVWFTAATRRLPLATVGLLQYISPSLQFLLAVLLFGEPFSRAHLVAFGLIWLGLAIFTLDALRAQSKPGAPAVPG